MIVTKKAISRRTILRGVGATVALPLLDAMIPALTAQARPGCEPIRVWELSIIRTASFTTNGCRGVGADFELAHTLGSSRFETR